MFDVKLVDIPIERWFEVRAKIEHYMKHLMNDGRPAGPRGLVAYGNKEKLPEIVIYHTSEKTIVVKQNT